MSNWQNREPCFLEILRRECGNIDLAMDIGASDGNESVFMWEHGAKQVDAFEPNPIFRNDLIDKFAELPINYCNEAVSDVYYGTTIFYYSAQDNLSSIIPVKHRKGKSRVATRSIDSLFPRKYNLIKMDIEGGEVAVLRGGRKAFSNNYPCKILWEVHPQTYTKRNDIVPELEHLLSNGFNFKYLVSATIIQPDQFRTYKPIWVPENKNRALYKNIPNQKCMEIICNNRQVYCPIKKKYGKSVRFAMLERK